MELMIFGIVSPFEQIIEILAELEGQINDVE